MGVQGVAGFIEPICAGNKDCLHDYFANVRQKDKRYCSDMRGIGTAVRREPPDWRDNQWITLDVMPQIASVHLDTSAMELHDHLAVLQQFSTAHLPKQRYDGQC